MRLFEAEQQFLRGIGCGVGFRTHFVWENVGVVAGVGVGVGVGVGYECGWGGGKCWCGWLGVVRACVRACVRTCMPVCGHVCVCACVRVRAGVCFVAVYS